MRRIRSRGVERRTLLHQTTMDMFIPGDDPRERCQPKKRQPMTEQMILRDLPEPMTKQGILQVQTGLCQPKKRQQTKQMILLFQTKERPQTLAGEASPGSGGGQVSLSTPLTIEQSRDRSPDDVFVSSKK
ncbi:hypothetical protein BT93_G1230 [Corymbia citriodora subsp. variegata]|nr:hypothetical protein BT93_G1230 [Corymbia citriodora subsp. variegata]